MFIFPVDFVDQRWGRGIDENGMSNGDGMIAGEPAQFYRIHGKEDGYMRKSEGEKGGRNEMAVSFNFRVTRFILFADVSRRKRLQHCTNWERVQSLCHSTRTAWNEINIKDQFIISGLLHVLLFLQLWNRSMGWRNCASGWCQEQVRIQLSFSEFIKLLLPLISELNSVVVHTVLFYSRRIEGSPLWNQDNWWSEERYIRSVHMLTTAFLYWSCSS